VSNQYKFLFEQFNCIFFLLFCHVCNTDAGDVFHLLLEISVTVPIYLVVDALDCLRAGGNIGFDFYIRKERANVFFCFDRQRTILGIGDILKNFVCDSLHDRILALSNLSAGAHG